MAKDDKCLQVGIKFSQPDSESTWDQDYFFMEAAQRMLGEEPVASKTPTKKSGGSSELQKLREENSRLKRTLADRFEGTFE